MDDHHRQSVPTGGEGLHRIPEEDPVPLVCNHVTYLDALVIAGAVRRPVPVVPMALRGLWGSFFSHCGGPALRHVPRRFWSRIELIAGEPLPAEKATAGVLEERVKMLRGNYH